LFDAFTTDSDCEVLLHLYKTKGPEFLEDTVVNGMYAFVLYDKMNDEYMVARDPFESFPSTWVMELMDQYGFHLK